jgi:molybdopterin molybdotransferase
MVEYQEAFVKIQNLALGHRQTKPFDTELIGIEKALNRVLSEDLFSPENVPSFNNSAMDGFAVSSDDTFSATLENPMNLEVTEVIGAGEFSQLHQNHPFSCIEIMTGAPVPDIYDAVIKVEDIAIIKDEKTGRYSIQISNSVSKFENIRMKGEDYKTGSPLLKKSTILMPEHIMALSTLGISEVRVLKKPRVVIISTGKELVPFQTQNLNFSQIRNSTGLFLEQFLQTMNIDVEFAGTIHDNPQEFFDLVQRIEKTNPDVILTTGAVSMGKYDFIKSCLADLGAEILFHKVAIRPGKPILLAKMKSGITFFGVPGNPISTAVGTRFFLVPYLKSLMLQSSESPMKARLIEDTKKPQGLRCFFKAKVNFSNHSVESLPGQASFMISPFTQSNAWVVFPEENTVVQKNTEVDIYPLYPLQYNWGSL